MKRISLSLLVVLTGVTTVSASPITLKFAGAGSGVFNSTSFTNALFTITTTANTDSVFIVSGSIYEIPVLSSFIDITGFATAAFTNSTFWADPQGAGDMELNDTISGNGILAITALFQGLEAYRFQTSIGPVSGFPFVPNVFGTFQNVPTTGGFLTMNTVTTASFAAVLSTPEPSSIWLLSLGFVALLLRVRELDLPRNSIDAKLQLNVGD